jgi:uncharacterized repeat protein (TIGR03803 family)
MAIPSAQAQTFTVLYTFTGLGDGAYPNGLVRDARGNLYGTTEQGGSFNYGTVFQLDTKGKEQVLHNFAAADGLNPSSTLIRDGAGNLYGTTAYGGTPEGGGCSYGCGTLFKLDKSGKESVLYAFTGQGDGGVPLGDLARDAAGSFYGAMLDTFHQPGGVFKVDKNGKETVLYQFTGKNDGGYPYGGVIRDNVGSLYGTTSNGGDLACSGGFGCGTIFKIDRTGKETVLYSFTDLSDGGFPNGDLIRDAEGNLYGTTSEGGNESCGAGCGIVFKLNLAGRETTLYSFTGPPDGKWPDGQSFGPGLVRDAAGNLYGTTQFGGAAGGCDGDGCGTVFKLDPSGHETVLHSFTGGADGSIPQGLILDAAGNLYGATNFGGNNGAYCARTTYAGCGVVFKLTP